MHVDVGLLIRPVLMSCFALQSLSDLYSNYEANKLCGESPELGEICREENVPWEPNFLSLTPPGIGRYMTFMVGEGVVFFLLVLLVESDLGTWIRSKLEQGLSYDVESDLSDEDEDVRAERLRLNGLNSTGQPDVARANPDILVIRNLNKFYNPIACLPVSQLLSLAPLQ